MRRIAAPLPILAAFSLALSGCGGGGDGNSVGGVAPTPTPSPVSGRLYADPAQESLSATDVQQIIAQAVGEAQARGLPSTIAVVDRVGNVLAVFRMNGANDDMVTSAFIPFLNAQNDPPIDAQGLTIPSAAGAIAKAITGAYLSSGGNAFSSRTASMIVQEHFPPAPTTPGLESGPLFGVQFSQLPCSDLVARASDGLIGPKRSPLGLAADPGGFPLYKNGVVVGGVGVMGDGDYGLDPNVLDVDTDAEEYIALAAIQGFAPPENILANRITVDGTTLRFSDASVGNLAALQTNFAAINGTAGALIAINGYTDGTLIAGTAYGTEASGIRRAGMSEFTNGDAFVLTDGAGTNRFPVRAATDGAAHAQPLTQDEAQAILEEAFAVMSRARAQIRRPVDSRAQVSISLVDTYGEVLGVVRSPDAPIFGTDVSLQKARTAAFFSNPVAAQQMLANPASAPFVQAVRDFLGDPNALTGTFAFADRSGGNLSRPYFPDGELGRPHGPFSRPVEDFNPFATGLQVQLIAGNLLQHVGFVLGQNADTPRQCTGIPASPTGQVRLANGIQIFPGSVPVYRDGVLVGGIGVSGDGIDQDDMISFLGANNAGDRTGTLGNAPKDIRADRIVVDLGDAKVRLRYISCPFAPFLDTDEQNVCEGL
ncbi:heme-binding protein [Croceicoccus sediminis]|uniref:heme-binding protein n=1 Tax=Croceicoccus sediminis TaxID=2571150 RepID=UPI001184628D|nr:heme-binding protein [Croceicoccus sediminis]